MNKIKDFIFNKKITLGLFSSLWILLFGSLFIMVGAIFVDFSFSKIFFDFAKSSPALFFLNLLPIVIVVTFMFLLFNNAVLSVMASGILFAIMAIANSEKIRLRQDPIFPADLKLVTELAGIAKGFTPTIIAIYAAIIIIAVFAIFFTAVFFKSIKIPLKARIAGIFLTAVTAAVLNSAVYAKEAVYASFSVDGNPYFEVNQYGSKGFVYSFAHKFNSMKVKPPKTYSKNEITALENSFPVNENLENEKFPHIIMIMGEAYADLSENENLDFSNYIDPMKEWKNLAESENSISGHIIVPKFGGGTSDTEFDVLTAMPTRYVGNESNSFNLIRKPIDSIPKRLKKIGYDTLAIHPGYSWFYNRSNVYNYMGFDDFIHLESFQGTEKYRGGYIADKYAADKIIETFEEHIQTKENPLFEFIVTIQNHGPYDEKYNEVENTFETNITLTEKEKTLLNSYFMGIKDADAEIKRLADYFEKSNEPVVLVYFGDHLPGFSNGMDFFKILNYNIDSNGTAEQLLNVYKTPFMIWQNSASKEIFTLEKNHQELKDGSTISANYLGAYLLEILEMEGLSPMADFSNSLRKELPVLTNSNFLLNNGEYTSQLSEELLKEVETLKNWVYYKMFDE